MDSVHAVNGSAPSCPDFISYTVKNAAGKVISIVLAFVFSNLSHQLLKPLSQPRIASDIAVGFSPTPLFLPFSKYVTTISN